MTTLLRIDSSSRHDGSHSRRIGDLLTARLAPGRIIHRDLAAKPVPHVDGRAVAAFFSDPAGWSADLRAAASLSEDLLGEIAAADDILITVPIYNFGVPSALKAWIDQVVRVGRTFAIEDGTFTGLVTGKRAFVVIAYGSGGYTDGAMQQADFVAPYLRFVLNFIGIDDITIIPVEGVSMGQDAARAAEARATARIADLLDAA